MIGPRRLVTHVICQAIVALSATVAVAQIGLPATPPSDDAADPPAAVAASVAAPDDDLAPRLAGWDAAVSEFDKLHTPDAPAFVVLGISPTEVQRPTTPTGVVIATVGGIASGTGTTIPVPKGLAVEFSPYWLFRHPDLSVLRYRSEDALRPLRTLSLSIGTTQTKRTEAGANGMSIDHTDSDIGLGFRTMLFQRGELDACTTAANAEALAMAQTAVLSASELAAVDAAKPSEREAVRKKLTETHINAFNTKVDDKYRKPTCVALVASTTGLSIDLAGAIDLRVLDSEITRGATSLAGYALWSDVSYDTTSMSGIGVVRIAGRKDGGEHQSMLDAGARGLFKQKRFAVSAEALVRHRFDMAADPATTYRVDVGIEYQVTDDNWLSVTFGKDFSLGGSDDGPWFSLANVHWGFGKLKL